MESGKNLKPQEIVDQWESLSHYQRRKILHEYADRLDELYHKNLYCKVYTQCDDDCGTDKYKRWTYEPRQFSNPRNQAVLEILDNLTLDLVKNVIKNLKE